MKRHFLVGVLLLLTTTISGQDDFEYEIATAQASLLHLQQKYKEAITLYEQAFSHHEPDALTAYKAAGMYSLDSNREKAFHYLYLALDKGWTETGWLAADPYFDYLKAVSPDQWDQLVKKAQDKESTYEQKLKKPLLRRRINELTLRDQQLRYLKIQNNDPARSDSIMKAIARIDKYNLDEAKKIIKENGWPKISDIGADGANNLWLIVQHADGDIYFQRQVLLLMTNMRKNGELNLENYAYLYDRVQCGLNFRQYYGTQVQWSERGTAQGFRPIAAEHTVDERRKACGMGPLRIYALTYGFHYTPVNKLQAIQSEQADQHKVRMLMDSALYYYRQKNYNKVYDSFNKASEIQGGMSNKDNYVAARICADIASITNSQNFKDISLDFLVLLHKRAALSKSDLQKEKRFVILHNEPRWKRIID